MQLHKLSRESALQMVAIEVDKALRIGPVKHIKHKAIPDGEHGLACLESHLLGIVNGQVVSLHDWGYYNKIKAPSIINPEAPRGFMITLKTDSLEENALRGRKSESIPVDAKTPNYGGDYIKIDWVYPHKAIQGLGIPRQYFYAVERAAKKIGYPSLHVDATNGGLSYWARKEFGLKIPKEEHESIVKAYQHFRLNAKKMIQLTMSVSPYALPYDGGTLPKTIDPTKPYSIPRIFMDVLAAALMTQGGHLHYYKKF